MSEEVEPDDADGEQTDREARYADVDTSHLDGVGDGCGCAEVWEHTSAERETRPEGASRDGEPSDGECETPPEDASRNGERRRREREDEAGADAA